MLENDNTVLNCSPPKRLLFLGEMPNENDPRLGVGAASGSGVVAAPAPSLLGSCSAIVSIFKLASSWQEEQVSYYN